MPAPSISTSTNSSGTASPSPFSPRWARCSLLGFALIAVPFSGRLVAAGLLAIPAVLLARAASVGILLYPARQPKQDLNKTWLVMTWGGLRGALSVALVLALLDTPHLRPLLPITYIVVVFSVLVQGLTMVPLLHRLGFAPPA